MLVGHECVCVCALSFAWLKSKDQNFGEDKIEMIADMSRNGITIYHFRACFSAGKFALPESARIDGTTSSPVTPVACAPERTGLNKIVQDTQTTCQS
jgi:hypothetical protein